MAVRVLLRTRDRAARARQPGATRPCWWAGWWVGGEGRRQHGAGGRALAQVVAGGAGEDAAVGRQPPRRDGCNGRDMVGKGKREMGAR